MLVNKEKMNFIQGFCILLSILVSPLFIFVVAFSEKSFSSLTQFFGNFVLHFRKGGLKESIRKLCKSFNLLFNFLFWNSFIRYFNPGISFIVFIFVLPEL